MIALFCKYRSFQVFSFLAIYFALTSSLPLEIHQGLYTISLLIKDLLLWMLPITVSFFIAHAVSSFEKKAPLFIVSILLFEFFSNAISVSYAFGCGHVAAQSLQIMQPLHLADSFNPLWRLPLVKPAWWSAEKGTLIGLGLGLTSVFLIPSLRSKLTKGKETAEWVLTKVFSRLIPLFILGFVARMDQTHFFSQMFSQYADFVLWLILFLMVYISFLFFVGSGLKFASFIDNIKNLLPAAGISFSSGCSLSTMPWTIEGTSKNLQNPELAKSVIPVTTNVQQVGDCVANAFLCFLIYLHFHGVAPSLSIWIPFSIVFVLARFATAAVIGGAVFIMLPIYESYLHFTPDMIAIILALNVLLDPVITCSNVVANGALCRIFERVWTVVLSRSLALKNSSLKG
jgi:hypothetical protein